MQTTIIALLLFLVGICFFYIWKYRKTAKNFERQRVDIETEELRMFDFLHSLGETLTQEGGTNPGTLYRTIVRGSAMVVEAHGAALYLIDKTNDNLVSQYQSEACPILIPVPEHIAQQAKTTPNTINSYKRLTSVGKEWGPFGEAFASKKIIKINNLSTNPHFKKADQKIHDCVSAIIAPLIYGGKELGILAVANNSDSEKFSQNDYEVFQSIAEQSSFALGNSIIHREAVEKKNLENELNTASEVQRILLPSKAPNLGGYSINGLNVPAKIVSGDYYDYFKIDENKLGIIIADVSGKGVPASLITAMCRSVVRANADKTHCPAEVLRKVNYQLFPDIREDMFISLAYVVLEENSGKIQIARAGHDAPLHYSVNKNNIEPINSPGIAIGIDSGKVFDKSIQSIELEMNQGDFLLLYTDGVNEASDIRGEEFGTERLYKTLINTSMLGSKEVVEGIQEKVTKFAGNVPQNDDITLIAIKRI
ncbi:MAG: SpoIIE family protein phosphatase [Verrucomicrobiales bacterium]|nr:MAG: GAF domain-containing protein [Verrucomicrobiota bacterium]